MKTLTPTAVAEATLEQLEQAWNRADGAGFGRAFTGDADFVDIRGTRHRGGDAIGEGHRAIFDSTHAGSTVRYELDVAREVAPGVIVAVASATLDAPTGPLRGTNHARLTAVITEAHGRWAVTAFHNTLVSERR